METQETTLAMAYRFCPRCGERNPNAGAVPFRCKHCEFACYFGPVGAVGALVVNSENKLLLVRRARDPGKGMWGLPGGFVDQDETVENALQREVQEETGLDVLQSDFLMTYPNKYVMKGVAAPVIDFFFCCKVNEKAKIELALDELDHHEWTHPEPRHLENMAFHSNRIAIETWLSR